MKNADVKSARQREGGRLEVGGTKRKAPAKDRGAVFYKRESTRLMLLLSRGNFSTGTHLPTDPN